jgi:hypothetical protein
MREVRVEGGREMTREEAADLLLRLRSENYLDDYDHFGEQEEIAIGIAIAALRGPVPDHETGLVRCGCGGKAKLYHYDVEDAFRDAFPDDYWVVFCDDCGIETGNEPTEQQAKTAWNTAMGYRA